MRLTFLFMPVDSWSYWECYGRRWKQSETKRSLLISVDTVSFFFLTLYPYLVAHTKLLLNFLLDKDEFLFHHQVFF